MLFVLPEVFTLVLGSSFDLPCLLATFWTPFPYSTYLTLIISVKEQSGKFHYVYRDITTGLLINIHCLSSLVTHESWVNFDPISVLPCPDSFKEFGEVGLSKYT